MPDVRLPSILNDLHKLSALSFHIGVDLHDIDSLLEIPMLFILAHNVQASSCLYRGIIVLDDSQNLLLKAHVCILKLELLFNLSSVNGFDRLWLRKDCASSMIISTAVLLLSWMLDLRIP